MQSSIHTHSDTAAYPEAAVLSASSAQGSPAGEGTGQGSHGQPTQVQGYWAGKRVLVTGGSHGLGRGLSLTLSRLGAQVVSVARGSDGLARLKAECPALQTIQADVSDKSAIYAIAGEAAGLLGGIDVLFNNASHLGHTPLRLLLDSDCEALELALQTNLLAPFRLAKAVAPGMLLQHGGLMVNISSDAAVNPYPTWGAYSVSKAGLDHLTRIFDAELRGQGIRFLAIDPGDMDTDLYRAAIPEGDYQSLSDPMTVASRLLQVLPSLVSLEASRWSASEWAQVLQTLQASGGVR